MSNAKIISTENISFEGNLLINSRTINRAGALYQRVEQRSSTANYIKVSELAELLILLESIATSGLLFYDGTIPSKDVDAVKAVEDSLEAKADCGNLFDIASPHHDDHLLAMCKSGIVQAMPSLSHRIDCFIRSPEVLSSELNDVQPLKNADPKKIRKFVDHLSGMDPPEDEILGHCKNVMRENFNGSKCVAGILSIRDDPLSSAEHSDFRQKCRELCTLFGHDDAKMRLIIPMFMNSFRANFLNSLANESGKAAFFSGPDTEHVLDCQVPLLANYFAKKMGDDIWLKLGAGTPMEDRMQSKSNFPFLGLLMLLDASPHEPYSVFKVAVSDKDPIRAAFLAQKGGQKRFIHDMNAAELEEFTHSKLDHIYSKMRGKYKLYDWINRVNSRYLQPAVSAYPIGRSTFECARFIAGSLGMDIPDVLEVDLPEMPEYSDSASTYALNQTLMPGAHLNNACYTQRISKRLATISQDPDINAVLFNQVEAVFGLELIADEAPHI